MRRAAVTAPRCSGNSQMTSAGRVQQKGLGGGGGTTELLQLRFPKWPKLCRLPGRGGAVAGVMALTTGTNAARLPDIPLMRSLEDVAAEE